MQNRITEPDGQQESHSALNHHYTHLTICM